MNKKVFITRSFEETQRIGKEFISRLILDKGVTLTKKRACVMALYGDLGSGKTTFVQGLAEGLGIKRRIISPTFIIVRSYVLKSQRSKVKTQNYNSKFKSLEPRSFYHIDLYRIDDKEGIKGLGIEEIMNNKESIIVIEWAEKMGDFLPKKRIDIEFFHEDINKRRIEINIGY